MFDHEVLALGNSAPKNVYNRNLSDKEGDVIFAIMLNHFLQLFNSIIFVPH